MAIQEQQVFPDGEWDCSIMFSTEELPDFTTELLGHCAFPVKNYEEKSSFSIPSAFFPNPEDINAQQSLDAANEGSLFYFMPQENSKSMNFSQENTYFLTHSNLIDQTTTHHYNSDPMDFCIMDQQSNIDSFTPVFVPEIAIAGMTNNRNESLGTNHQHEANAAATQKFQLKRKLDSEVNQSKNVRKKKTRVTSSSSYCLEDDNAPQDSNSDHSKLPETNLDPKKKASRGSATDPQSLYARKRRESINERLRVLQKLVPNGTKVDISTMLEEAFDYVKFLQIQIRLLGSDDLWMYEPIAYNGMDIGLSHKIAMML